MICMNKAVFEEYTAKEQPVLVEYWAPWCGYCTRIAPAMEKIDGQFPDLAIGQVNVDDEPQLTRQEQIELIPTLVIYRGGKALGSIVAPESRTAIEDFIQRTLEQ